MNKSIAKTRNELERITYKINQLKTKYTGESYLQHGYENSPTPHDHKNSKPNIELREPAIDNFQNKCLINVSNNVNNSKPHNLVNGHSNPSSSGICEETYQKQFKVFRNQMYNYIDKCVLVAKEREQQIIDKALLSSSRRSNVAKGYSQEAESRLKKIEEQTTACIASIQQIAAQVKKNEKNMIQKVGNVQIKLRKQIKEIQQTLSDSKIKNASEHISEIVQVKLDEFEIEYESKRSHHNETILQQCSIQQSQISNIKKMVEQINQHSQKLKQQITDLKAETKAESKQDSDKLKLLKDKIKIQIEQHVSKLEQSLQNKRSQIGYVSQSLLDFGKRLEDTIKSHSQFKQSLQSQASKYETIESRIKTVEKSTTKEAQQKIKCELLAELCEQVSKQVQSSVQSSYIKPRLQQMKRELASKSSQQLEFNKQEILISVEESIFEKINKLQKIKRNSPKSVSDIEDSRVKANELREIQANMKNFVSAEIDRKIEQQSNPRNRFKTEEKQLSTSQIINDNKIEELIESKLNQFQNDINQTIKLLYEDVENRVNEIVASSGINELKAGAEITSSLIKQMESKINSLMGSSVSTAVGITQKTSTQSKAQQYNKQYEHLREEVYSAMGAQIDRLSHILERTVEEMEIKVEKLDQNFTYVYERMSKIEYDNASFKDQLISVTSCSPSEQAELTKSGSTVSLQNQQSNLLNVLGQYSAGRYFYES